MKSQRIYPYSAWLIKGSDQILAESMIDTRLSSDAGIDLRNKSRRHLNIRNATLIDRGSKPCHVAHDATAERQQHRRPFKSMPRQHVEDMFHRLQRFRSLSGSQNDRKGIDSISFNRLEATLQVMPSDMS